MPSSSSDLPPATPPTAQMHDALDAWGAEVGGDAVTPLAAVRIDANERIVIPFTTQVQSTKVHYLKTTELTGYVQCLGNGCMLCQAGKKPEDRGLLPVYDVEEQAVGILCVAPNLRQNALRALLMPILRRLHQGERLVVTISHSGHGRYTVNAQLLADSIDDGAGRIQQFLRNFENGGVDLAAVFPRLTNEELASIPGIASILKVKGN
ncbi:MAG: hypothetical protein WCL32_21650 [Planctomycetota bacterium]